MNRRPTLADIAARAGLSTAAVSMILNDRPGTRLSAETAERVRAIAAELRYRPNPAARSLRVGKTATVGFISDDVTVTRYASAMIRGLLDVADEHDHTVLIAETGHDAKRMTEAVEVMLDRNVDGIVFGALGARQIELPPIPAAVPVVLVNAATAEGHTNVLPDEYEAGFGITRLLLEGGAHSRIALVGTSPWAERDPTISVTIGLRSDGIRDAAREFGSAIVAEKPFRSWEPKYGYAGTTELLDSGEDFTALICLNDNLAFGAYQALQERGLRIPEDMSIVSFDDDEIAGYLRPGLTTVRIPYEEMGRRAMQLVLDPGRPAVIPRVPMPIHVRESIQKSESNQ